MFNKKNTRFPTALEFFFINLGDLLKLSTQYLIVNMLFDTFLGQSVKRNNFLFTVNHYLSFYIFFCLGFFMSANKDNY